MGFMGGETGYCSETCVSAGVGGTGEVSIKVEEAIDIKDEITDAAIFPPIKTEQEVRLWSVNEVVEANAVRPFIAQKGNPDVTCNCFVLLC
jgi:hypothetical protein